MLTHFPTRRASIPLSVLTKQDIRPLGKFFTNAYCIHVCSTHPVSNNYIHWPALLSFQEVGNRCLS